MDETEQSHKFIYIFVTPSTLKKQLKNNLTMHSIAERHKIILETLNKNGFVKITDIAQELGVTTVTIRKDIKILADKGLLYKVHGSARAVNPHVSDTKFNIKNSTNMENKNKIAAKMAELVESNDSLIISSGSTAYTVASHLLNNSSLNNINVVTASLKVAVMLGESAAFNVIQLGGPVSHTALSTLSNEQWGGFDFICNKFILGVDGIDVEAGISTATVEEARMTQKMIDRSTKTIVVADSSKFGVRGFGRICGFDDIDMLITDAGAPKSMIEMIEDAGVEVLIVE